MERKTNIEKLNKQKIQNDFKQKKKQYINNYKQRQALNIYNLDFDRLTYGQKENLLYKANEDWENYRIERGIYNFEETNQRVKDEAKLFITSKQKQGQDIFIKEKEPTNQIVQEPLKKLSNDEIQKQKQIFELNQRNLELEFEMNELLEESSQNISFNQNPIIEEQPINTEQYITVEEEMIPLYALPSSLNVSVKREFDTPTRRFINVNMIDDLSSIHNVSETYSMSSQSSFESDFGSIDEKMKIKRELDFYKDLSNAFYDLGVESMNTINEYQNYYSRPLNESSSQTNQIFQSSKSIQTNEIIEQQNFNVDNTMTSRQKKGSKKTTENYYESLSNDIIQSPPSTTVQRPRPTTTQSVQSQPQTQPQQQIIDEPISQQFQRRGEITLDQSELIQMIRDLNYLIQFAVNKGSSADLFQRLPFKNGNTYKYQDPEVKSFGSALSWMKKRGVTDWYDLTTNPSEVINLIKILEQGGRGNTEKLTTTYKILNASGILPLKYLPIEGQPTKLKTKNVTYLQDQTKQQKTENFTVGGKNYSLKLSPKGFEVSNFTNRRYFDNYQDAVFFIKSDGFTKKGLMKPITMFQPVIKNLSQAIY